MLRAAVIGVGNMGRHHARNYFELKKTKLVAIADVDKKQGEALAKQFDCKYYQDYREMLDKEELDLATIAVPTKLHKEVALAVIEKGINTLIEKPIAATCAQAQEIIEAAKKKKVKLTVGHIERFNPALIKLKEFIDKGRLGEIKSITVRRVGLLPPQIKDSNVVVDIGVHDIDIVNYLYGRLPEKYWAVGGRALGLDREDYAEIFLKFGDRAAHISVNWITPVKIRHLSINGTKAYAELDFISQNLEIYDHPYKFDFDDFGDFVIKYGQPKDKQVVSISKNEPLKAEINAFVDSIIKDERPSVTTKEAIDALKIALDISKSISK